MLRFTAAYSTVSTPCGKREGLLLDMFVADFARGRKAADALRLSVHGGSRVYQAGTGPRREPDGRGGAHRGPDAATCPRKSASLLTQVRYPHSPQTCDEYWNGEDGPWAIEVKMIRFRHDNGKLADLSIQDILSPFSGDHSALSDCLKLVRGGFPARTALVIYAFEDQERPVDCLIEAFEYLAAHYVVLGARDEVRMSNLIHPVHAAGRVFGWRVSVLPH